MTARALSTFVALGDSFTEGLDDLRPDGSVRGWADRVADGLARTEPGFRYANLALRSLRVDAVVDEQVPAALELCPDVVSIAAGGNDILGLRTDVHRVAARMQDAVRRLAATGAVVIMFGGFDPRPHLPPGRLLTARTASYNRLLAAIAFRHQAVFVDLWSMPELHDIRLWSPDRLHLSALGHLHVAGTILEVLGRPTPEGWPVATEPARRSRIRGAASTLGWSRDHFVPWTVRKVRGRPAAHGLTPKHRTLQHWHSGGSGPDTTAAPRRSLG